jgi:LmbE family N-acetylglucosaminyl deacetylase/SAM-dependent methyltransferase
MTASFRHSDEGTPESVWREDLGRRTLPPLDVSVETLVVIAAHPDDESLGAGGLIARAARYGARVVVIVATDGEASHPRSPTHAPDALARRRREEVRRAVAALAPSVDLRFLGLPDGGLEKRSGQFRERLVATFDALRVADASRVLVASTWSRDRHRDHRVTAEVAAQIARHRRFLHIEYPIWAWHWGTPADLPWDRAVALHLTDEERQGKLDALACHASQIEALSDLPGDEALLHAGMQEHFHRDIEVFFSSAEIPPAAPSLPAAWFDDFYRRHGEDPWGFESRWYEERKRALLMAALPTRSLGDVLEIGCSTGLLTRALADRARTVTAIDAAEAAVHAARARLAGDARVRVLHGAVPGDWPAGRFDTIVLSEVGYYLSEADLRRTLGEIEQALADDGCLVACHWRHPVDAYPQTGDDVHRVLRSVADWETLSLHEERDFVLEVLVRRPARSVAEAEGLA